jgi:hypothetical protein
MWIYSRCRDDQGEKEAKTVAFKSDVSTNFTIRAPG